MEKRANARLRQRPLREPELIRDRDKLVRHLRKTLKAEIKGWDLSQNKAIHQTLNYLLNRITSLGSNSP